MGLSAFEGIQLGVEKERPAVEECGLWKGRRRRRAAVGETAAVEMQISVGDGRTSCELKGVPRFAVAREMSPRTRVERRQFRATL